MAESVVLTTPAGSAIEAGVALVFDVTVGASLGTIDGDCDELVCRTILRLYGDGISQSLANVQCLYRRVGVGQGVSPVACGVDREGAKAIGTWRGGEWLEF